MLSLCLKPEALSGVVFHIWGGIYEGIGYTGVQFASSLPHQSAATVEEFNLGLEGAQLAGCTWSQQQQRPTRRRL